MRKYTLEIILLALVVVTYFSLIENSGEDTITPTPIEKGFTKNVICKSSDDINFIFKVVCEANTDEFIMTETVIYLCHSHTSRFWIDSVDMSQLKLDCCEIVAINKVE